MTKKTYVRIKVKRTPFRIPLFAAADAVALVTKTYAEVSVEVRQGIKTLFLAADANGGSSVHLSSDRKSFREALQRELDSIPNGVRVVRTPEEFHQFSDEEVRTMQRVRHLRRVRLARKRALARARKADEAARKEARAKARASKLAERRLAQLDRKLSHSSRVLVTLDDVNKQQEAAKAFLLAKDAVKKAEATARNTGRKLSVAKGKLALVTRLQSEALYSAWALGLIDEGVIYDELAAEKRPRVRGVKA